MIKTGTVVSVMPTQAGGYNSQNGYIYTFDMVINTPEGQVGGEIGAKSQAYPVGPGQPITVDVTDGQYGPRLKKINPQYQQGGGPQGGGGQQSKGRDYDKENRGKCRFGFYQACIRRGCDPVEMVQNKPLLDAVETLIGWSMNGRPQQPQGATGGGPNPNYNPNPAPTDPDDDVPF